MPATTDVTMTDAAPMTFAGCAPPPAPNSITVNKDFIPNNAATVPVALTCNSGTVTTTPLTASEAAPAVFTVTGAVKAAMIHYTASQAAMLAPQRIRVNCIAAGPVVTPAVLAVLATAFATLLARSAMAADVQRIRTLFIYHPNGCVPDVFFPRAGSLSGASFPAMTAPFPCETALSAGRRVAMDIGAGTLHVSRPLDLTVG